MKKSKHFKLKVALCIILAIIGVGLVIQSFIVGDLSLSEIASKRHRYVSKNGSWVYSVSGYVILVVDYILATRWFK